MHSLVFIGTMEKDYGREGNEETLTLGCRKF
jgi:hypothetical protein